MPFLSDRQSVAANTTIANALASKTQEFLTRDSILQFAVNAAAVGMNATIIVGDTVVVEDQEVSAINRMGIFPDDFVYQAAGMPNDRLVVKLHNTTGAAIVAFTSVAISPA